MTQFAGLLSLIATIVCLLTAIQSLTTPLLSHYRFAFRAYYQYFFCQIGIGGFDAAAQVPGLMSICD